MSTRKQKSRLKWSKDRGVDSYNTNLGRFRLSVSRFGSPEWSWYWSHSNGVFMRMNGRGTSPDLEAAKLAAEASVRAFVAKFIADELTLPEEVK